MPLLRHCILGSIGKRLPIAPQLFRKVARLVFLSRFLMMACCLLAAPAFAQHLAGRVVEVKGGDALILNDAHRQRHKIRLVGIAAPKMTQPHGQEATARLSAMVFNREVEIVDGRLDRNSGEMIGKVMAADPRCNDPTCPKIRDGGLEQVMAGMAWWDRRTAELQAAKDREAYQVAEFNAKIRRLGLWADKNPLPPWQWRGG